MCTHLEIVFLGFIIRLRSLAMLAKRPVGTVPLPESFFIKKDRLAWDRPRMASQRLMNSGVRSGMQPLCTCLGLSLFFLSSRTLSAEIQVTITTFGMAASNRLSGSSSRSVPLSTCKPAFANPHPTSPIRGSLPEYSSLRSTSV